MAALGHPDPQQPRVPEYTGTHSEAARQLRPNSAALIELPPADDPEPHPTDEATVKTRAARSGRRIGAVYDRSQDGCIARRLPERAHGILGDQGIGGDQREAAHDGLADQHAVEGIAVQLRELSDGQGSAFVERERFDVVSRPYVRNKRGGLARERQLTERVLDGDLPGGDGAQIDVVVRIRERLPRHARQRAIARRDPEEGAGIEEELHEPPRNAVTISSGSGSKKRGGILSSPRASPMGRDFFSGWGKPLSSATGRF